jgi:hypothetical protein
MSKADVSGRGGIVGSATSLSQQAAALLRDVNHGRPRSVSTRSPGQLMATAELARDVLLLHRSGPARSAKPDLQPLSFERQPAGDRGRA